MPVHLLLPELTTPGFLDRLPRLDPALGILLILPPSQGTSHHDTDSPFSLFSLPGAASQLYPYTLTSYAQYPR